MLCAAVGDELKGNETDRISVSRGFLRHLVQAALSAVPFDESTYLQLNPDLREAWKGGKISDLRQHWILSGYFEGRKASNLTVDEEWYLTLYPDVRFAIDAGQVQDATEHFASAGETEWRIPNPALEHDVQRWRQACLTQVAPIGTT
jgi:hypothetical protein